DIAVLQTEDLVERVQFSAPTKYPVLPAAMPRQGSSVGYLGRLKLEDSITTYFAQVAVSMRIVGRNASGCRFMLSEGIIQSGFSGTAVFSPDGVLHGVLVESFQFPVDSGHPVTPVHTRPVMASVGAVLSDIHKFVQR